MSQARTAGSHHPRLAVSILCAAGIVVALMQTIIVPLIPDLPKLLHSDPANTTWALTITLLVGSVVTPIGGRLGDMIGKRLMLIASMSCVVLGSIVCAVSGGLVLFLIGRGLQGLGFGAIALGISVMRDIVPPDRLAASVGTMSASLGVGGALGLPFAATIAQHLSWHALFWVCAAAGALSAVGIALTVPESPNRTGGRFDVLGTLGLIVMLSCLLLPLSKGASWGWGSPSIIALFAGFVVAAIIWRSIERRIANPLIDLDIARAKPVLLTNIASIATGFAFYSMQLMPIQVLMAPTAAETGLGLDMVTASTILAPGGIVMFAFSHVSARLTTAFGPRISLATGGAVIGIGYAMFIVMLIGGLPVSWWTMLINGAIIGAGLGIAYSAMPALIMASVPVEQTGEANGVNALMRIVGTSTSAAVVGMILTWSLTGLGVPSTAGYLWASGISLAACAVAAAIALSIPEPTPSGHVENV